MIYVSVVYQQSLTCPIYLKILKFEKKRNTRNSLVDSIFSNTASPISRIKKACVHFYIGASKYYPTGSTPGKSDSFGHTGAG